jgi:[protein-PII] uridylyltransferase
VETVEWLVRNHLVMSDVAQKRDLADPRTVRGFAKAVKTKKRLDLLTVLTVCDIRGVGPNVWNNWKAQLLRQLYRDTATALETGIEDIGRETRSAEAKPAPARRALRLGPEGGADRAQRHYDPYWQGMPAAAHVVFARLLKDLGDDEIRLDLYPDEDRDATRACFALADHPGIFSRLAGRWRSSAPTSWTRAPTPRRTATRPPSSGSRTRTARPSSCPACRACAP